MAWVLKLECFKFKAVFFGAGGDIIGDGTRMLFRLVLIR
jgi:hypothetical protein